MTPRSAYNQPVTRLVYRDLTQNLFASAGALGGLSALFAGLLIASYLKLGEVTKDLLWVVIGFFIPAVACFLGAMRHTVFDRSTRTLTIHRPFLPFFQTTLAWSDSTQVRLVQVQITGNGPFLDPTYALSIVLSDSSWNEEVELFRFHRKKLQKAQQRYEEIAGFVHEEWANRELPPQPEAPEEDPDSWNPKGFPALISLLGVPVRIAPAQLTANTDLTKALIIVISIVSILLFPPRMNWTLEAYGFVPATPFRMGGLTWLSSFFLHAGFAHLIFNMYYLFTFGELVEAAIGKWKYLSLLALAHFGSNLLEMIASPQANATHFGSSGGIVGVQVFCLLAIPATRFGMCFLWMIWLRISPAWLLALFLFTQLSGYFTDRISGSETSYVGHLGGAIIGALFWLAWRFQRAITGISS